MDTKHVFVDGSGQEISLTPNGTKYIVTMTTVALYDIAEPGVPGEYVFTHNVSPRDGSD